MTITDDLHQASMVVCTMSAATIYGLARFKRFKEVVMHICRWTGFDTM